MFKTIFMSLIIIVFSVIARANTYQVTTTADSGPGSLRQAIIDSNLHPAQGTDKNFIGFHIPGSGVKSIRPQSPLPAILYSVEIDGRGQNGYGMAPVIEINGVNAGANASGLRVVSGVLTLKGIAINSFRRYGIYVAAPGRIGSLTNCRIGTDVSGTVDRGNGGDGIYLTGGFSDPEVKSFMVPAFDEASVEGYRRARNVISGNGGNGIRITNSHPVHIGGNYIGTDANGLEDLGNDENGILFTGGRGEVGDDKVSDFMGEGGIFLRKNVISGNAHNGIKISDSANNITVSGNYVGTTANGRGPLGNSLNGVWVTNFDAEIHLGVFFIEWGGRDGNVISANGENGVKITGAGVGVANNLIGTDVDGLLALGNGQHGVLMSSSNNQVSGHNIIGSNGTKNIISANKGDGIRTESGANDNVMLGNNIGTNITGGLPLGNGGNGVSLMSSGNHLGGTEQRTIVNIISTNAGHGVVVANGSQNVISANFIGTIPPDGNADLGNGGDGVRIINGATDSDVVSNEISFNGGKGINIYRQFVGALPLRNKLRANRLIHNAGLAIDLGNNGPTTNDAGDSDTGPNAFQNYPVVTRANDYVTTTLNSLPNKTYHIELFRTGCTLPNLGTQAELVRFFEVVTDGNGHATYGFPVQPTFPSELAATATDPEGNTSELTPCPQVASTVSFATGPLTVDEAAGTAIITVFRAGNTPVSVNYSTSNGTTTASADYAPTAGVLSFNFIEFMKTFTIPIVNDSLDEENETITITLSNPTNGGTIAGTNPVTLTIVDNDPPPSLTINDFGGPEGPAGGNVNFVFNVNLSGPSAKTITVDYATNDVTATAGTDYVATSGQLIFQPGETSKTVPVSVLGDGTLEADETFAVALGNVSNAVALDNAGTGTILNDDKIASLSFSTGSYSVSESGTSAVITVVRTNDLTGTISVDFAATAGTAAADLDFQAVSGTLTFADGVTTRTFEVPIVSDDINETNETVNLVLANPTGLSTISAPSSAVLTILDDDDSGLPSLTISDVSMLEGNSGSTDAVFTVTLSDVSNEDITVNYATVDVTALAGQDYEPVADVLTIPAGAVSAQIVVKIKGDVVVEADETFRVVLTNPVNAVFNESEAAGTILNDDADQAERIAFTSNRNGDNEIYLMNLDGSNEIQLTNNVVNDSDPAWSPDRTKIAFVSHRHGHADILVMKPDGTLLASVTNDAPVDGDPVWSPDGTKIAFTRFKSQNQSEVYIVDAGGTNLTPVATGPRSEREPAWSPDGKFIAFARDIGGSTEIFVINLLTKVEVKLTSNEANDGSPSWSPDGLRLAFVSDRDGVSQIYTMKINGEDVQQLTTEGVNLDPAYSADGSRIWFTSNRTFISNFEIFSMNADGTNQHQLTTHPAADTKPAR